MSRGRPSSLPRKGAGQYRKLTGYMSGRTPPAASRAPPIQTCLRSVARQTELGVEWELFACLRVDPRINKRGISDAKANGFSRFASTVAEYAGRPAVFVLALY